MEEPICFPKPTWEGAGLILPGADRRCARGGGALVLFRKARGSVWALSKIWPVRHAGFWKAPAGRTIQQERQRVRREVAGKGWFFFVFLQGSQLASADIFTARATPKKRERGTTIQYFVDGRMSAR